MFTSFSAEASAALPGPPWARDRRRRAADQAAAVGLPDAEAELWRYSPIGDLDLSAYTPAPRAGDPDSANTAAAGALAGLLSGPHVLVTDGFVESATVPAGVEVIGPDHADYQAALIRSDLDDDAFGWLNTAFGPEALVLRVAAGTVVDGPIVVLSATTTDATACFPRIVVEAGADSEFTVVESQVSGEQDALVVPVTHIDVGPSARVKYVTAQHHGPAVRQIARQTSVVEASGSLHASTAALGAAYGRSRSDCRLVGRGASGDLVCAYLGSADQTLDFRTFQEHAAPDTTSNLLFKGAVGGRARSVYTGLIRVRPEARGTQAIQTNRNLKLSDDAWAESVPNLEIENNEVQCSHASAVGPVDPEQRFYLESRGVPPMAADRLIVRGFFDEVLEAIPVDAVADDVRLALSAELDRLHREVAA